MSAIGISGVGVAAGPGAVGLEALAALARWPNAPAGGAAAPADPRESTALRRRTGLRYLDPVAERAARALEAAGAGGEPDPPDPSGESALRSGILMVTRLGPTSTREQLYKSFAERQGKGVSATLFSNCGYNIAAAVMAKVRGIRGPSLTFAATPGWGARVLRVADGLFARAADTLYLSYADGNAAIVLRAEPWERISQRGSARSLRVLDALGSARTKPVVAVGSESGVAGEAGLRVALSLEGGSPGLALDQTFLSIAWLWETYLSEGRVRLDVAPFQGGVVAFEISEPAGRSALEGAIP